MPPLLFPPNYSVGILRPFQPYIGASFRQFSAGERFGSSSAARFHQNAVDQLSFASWKRIVRCNGAEAETDHNCGLGFGVESEDHKLDLSLRL